MQTHKSILEICSLLADKKDESYVHLAVRWCTEHMRMELEVSSKLIYNILSSGIDPMEMSKILKLLDKYKIQESDHVGFVNMILIALNGSRVI